MKVLIENLGVRSTYFAELALRSSVRIANRIRAQSTAILLDVAHEGRSRCDSLEAILSSVLDGPRFKANRRGMH